MASYDLGFRTGRAVSETGSTSSGVEAKRGTPAGHPPATSGAIGDMPFTVFMLYFLLVIHVVLMGGYLVYSYI